MSDSNTKFPQQSQEFARLPEEEADEIEIIPSSDTSAMISPTTPISRPKPRIKIPLTARVLILFFFANFFYILSDTECPFEDPSQCAREFILPHLERWAIQIFISALLFTTLIYTGLKKKIPFFYALAAFLNVLYLCFFYNPILSVRNYGQMFAFFLALSLIICFSCLGFALLVRFLYKKRPAAVLLIPLTILLFCAFFYFAKVKNSCDHWTKGLGNEQMLAEPGTCRVEQPSVCPYEVTDGWFDLSRFKTCSAFKADPEILEKYYGDAPVIGFPRTEKFADAERWPLQKNMLSRVVPLSGMNDPAGADLEIFLDKTSEKHPKLKINIKRNETLVKEREKIQSDPLVKNVLVIYIDALSRVNALRQLKKTMNWFNQHMNQQSSEAETFQFFKYHSIVPYTYSNLHEVFYGIHPYDPSLSKDHPLDTFVKTYKEKGFITGHSSDFCQMNPLDIGKVGKIRDIPFDHEAVSIACEPHYHDPISPYGIFKGPYSSMRRCLYGKDMYEHVLDYGNQFWHQYKDQKKLMYMDFIDAHEGTNEVVKYADDALYKFLTGLQSGGLLEDTSVILYADHGLHMQGIFQLMQFNQVEIEKYLPALYFTLPKKVSEKYRNDIKANQQSIVSGHELHNFFMTMAEGETCKDLSTSLIGPLKSYRDCDDIKMMVDACFCFLDEKKF